MKGLKGECKVISAEFQLNQHKMCNVQRAGAPPRTKSWLAQSASGEFGPMISSSAIHTWPQRKRVASHCISVRLPQKFRNKCF